MVRAGPSFNQKWSFPGNSISGSALTSGTGNSMPQQERALPKRRRQILDDETGDTLRFNAREYQHTWLKEDSWMKSFMARLTGLMRNMSGRK